MVQFPGRAEMRKAINESVLTARVLRTSAERVAASREAIRQSDVLCGLGESGQAIESSPAMVLPWQSNSKSLKPTG